jgi:predicted phage terminase large subunit-like protein
MKKTTGSLLSDPRARHHLAMLLKSDHLCFAKYFFRKCEGAPFRTGPHHKVMCDTIDRVFAGEISRLIINVPPGYTKTALAIVNFVARGFAINPYSKFIHVSYSQKLAFDNSSKIRALIGTPEYQTLFPLAMAADTDAKGLWKTSQGGGLLADSSGGQVTGFRAGTMDDGFTGALLIDDPLKPDDAFSEGKRTFINDRYKGVLHSRLAKEGVPVIVIMQRLHENDFTGNLLSGGGKGEHWHHLMLPVDVDNSDPYPEAYNYGLPIAHHLPDGPLWPEKHGAEAIKMLATDPYEFAGQYQQRPTPLGGGLFKGDWIRRYTKGEQPRMQWRAIFGDTAQKTGEKNDYTVFEHWGLGKDGNIYLLDVVRGKFEAPELEKTARSFWSQAKGYDEVSALRGMYIEDAASGTGLIQSLKRSGDPERPPIPVIGITRQRDKFSRAMDVVNYFATGRVWLLNDEPFMPAFLAELMAFPNGAHDDQVDPMIDAIDKMLVHTTRVIGAFKV